MTTQQQNKSDSVLETESRAADTEARQNRQDHYTPTPEEAKEHFEKYLQVLPLEPRRKLEKYNQVMITEALGEENVAPGLDGLLPALKTVDSAIILKTIYPPIPFIIPDYLPAGLTFLIGKPKVGKSWLAIQLA